MMTLARWPLRLDVRLLRGRITAIFLFVSVGIGAGAGPFLVGALNTRVFGDRRAAACLARVLLSVGSLILMHRTMSV